MKKSRQPSKSASSDTDFDRLLGSISEMVATEASGNESGRSSVFEGHVLVQVKEGRKTIWTLQDAATELQAILAKTTIDSFSEVVMLARKVLRQSQDGFAELLGISIGTLRGWEQGRRVPQGPAQTLLRVAIKHPRALLDTVTDRSFAVDF